MNIAAIVVTFNRSDLLEECVVAISKQSVPINKLYIIDNCSTDNTHQIVEKLSDTIPNIDYCRLNENIGGAGGFNYGMRKACENKHDYLWIMDDDTIPNENSLEKMILNEKIQDIYNWGFLCSNVFWTDGSPCIMNTQSPDKLWNKYLHYGLIPVKGTSFVSVLIPRSVVEKVGLPIKEFFIWGDDAEYTRRIKQYYEGFLVSQSTVVHKMKKNVGVDILSDNSGRVDRYFFEYRNKYFIRKSQGNRSLLKYYIRTFKTLLKLFIKPVRDRNKKILILFKGFVKGISFNPQIEYL